MYVRRLRIGRAVLCAVTALPAFSVVAARSAVAQSSSSAAAISANAVVASSGVVAGSVFDPRGVPLPGAAVVVRSDATGATVEYKVGRHGQVCGERAGAGPIHGAGGCERIYDEQGAGECSSQRRVGCAGDAAAGNVTEQVTVEANAAGSVAAALAPMDALLDETSARTEITQALIQNFMSPVADYGEAVEMAPGTFTTNSNGVGLGQSNTYFRGFPDGNYDIDFDGIPFYDTNTPTHHSWAFFPSQWLGGIDFDRSPGTASTIGPTPFGGSIHLLSQRCVAGAEYSRQRFVRVVRNAAV